MKKRWLVVTEFRSAWAVPFYREGRWEPAPPVRTFRYFRWRWVARLVAAIDSMPPGFPGYMLGYQRARVVGRVILNAD